MENSCPWLLMMEFPRTMNPPHSPYIQIFLFAASWSAWKKSLDSESCGRCSSGYPPGKKMASAWGSGVSFARGEKKERVIPFLSQSWMKWG